MLGKVISNGEPDPGLPSIAAVVARQRREVLARDIHLLREHVSACYSSSLSAATLKQADEQTLLALATVGDAVSASNIAPQESQRWGLIVAARSPGRKRIADSLARFRSQGAWSVSPHIIPHCSLHSASGMLSQGLKLHGPNIGAGGVAGAESEAFWAAMAWLHGERIPGVWMVFSAWDRESTSQEHSVCRAVALGLASVGSGRQPGLVVSPGPPSAGVVPFRFEELWDHFDEPCRWAIGGGEFRWRPASDDQRAAA